MDIIEAGSTNRSVLFAMDTAGLTIADLKLGYIRWSEGDGTSFTEVLSGALTALGTIITAHTDNRAIYLDADATGGNKFVLRVDFPDAAFATTKDRVICNVYDDGNDVVAHRVFSLNPNQSNLIQIGGVAQSATDLKDFADAGYDPATNSVEQVKVNDDVRGTDGVDTATMRGTDNAVLASLFTGITSLAEWLGLIAGKQVANATALTEVKATGAGSGTYDESTDSLEVIGDNTGGAGMTDWSATERANIREALGVDGTKTSPTGGTGRIGYPEGAVYFLDTAANTNTVIGVDGTMKNPVSDWPSAQSLADALGTKKIIVAGTMIVTTDAKSYTFIANSTTSNIGSNNTQLTVNAATDFLGNLIIDLDFTTANGTFVDGNNTYLRCHLFGSECQLAGTYRDCRFNEQEFDIQKETVIIGGSADAGIPNLIFDLEAVTDDLFISRLAAAQITIRGTTLNNVVTIVDSKALITLDSSNLGGTINLVGDYEVSDSSASTVNLNLNGLQSWNGTAVTGDGAWATDVAPIIGILGAPVGASVSADIAAVKAETAVILTDTNDILVDTNEMQGKLPTNNIMGSSVKTDKDDEIDAIKITTDKFVFTSTGRVDSNMEAINNVTSSAAKFEQGAAAIETGAAIAGTLSTTDMTTDLSETTTNHYVGLVVKWTTGALAKQGTRITGYDGVTKKLTFVAITDTPVATDKFVIN